MTPPDLSVVTTVYNGARFVADCVRSVQAQDGPSIEHVVVDDGSTDATATVLARFDHPGLVILKRPRIGRGRALNEALAACRGRYVAILDVDDVALPGRLSRPTAHLDAHPDVDLVGSGHWVYVDEAGAELGRRREAATTDAMVRRLLRRRRAPFAHSSVTARRAALEAVGGYDEDLLVALDLALYVRIAAHGHLAVLDEPLVAVRCHEGQYFFGRQGDTRSMRRRVASRRAFDRHAKIVLGGSTSATGAAVREAGSWVYWQARRRAGPGPVLPARLRRSVNRLWASGPGQL